MQDSNSHSKTVVHAEHKTNFIASCATGTPATPDEIIYGEFVQDRQLNKIAIAALKPIEKIQRSK